MTRKSLISSKSNTTTNNMIDLNGEFDIDDFVVFSDEDSCLHDVGVMWVATKKYTKAIHETIAALVAATAPSGEMSDDVETAILREDDHKSFSLAEKYLLVTSIVTMQCAFLEYALKRTYSEVITTPTLPSKPRFRQDIVDPLVDAGFIDKKCFSQLCDMQPLYDDIRNKFSHGDWASLPKACESLDLFKFFMDVGKVLWSIEGRMKANQGRGQ